MICDGCCINFCMVHVFFVFLLFLQSFLWCFVLYHVSFPPYYFNYFLPLLLNIHWINFNINCTLFYFYLFFFFLVVFVFIFFFLILILLIILLIIFYIYCTLCYFYL